MRKSTSFTPMQDLSAALVSLVASTAPSLVSVSSSRSRSSGFVWRPGLIVTADEALSEDGEFTIKLWNGDAVPAQLVGHDSTTDIALLRVDHTDLQPISLTPLTVQAGGPVIAVGADDGEQQPLRRGHTSIPFHRMDDWAPGPQRRNLRRASDATSRLPGSRKAQRCHVQPEGLGDLADAKADG